VAVALADKLDTLLGFFSVGIKPTGSRDPFALRRTAIGLIGILRQNSIRDDIFWILENHSFEFYDEIRVHFLPKFRENLVVEALRRGDTNFNVIEPNPRELYLVHGDARLALLDPNYFTDPKLEGEQASAAVRGMFALYEFLADRLQVMLREEGHRYDIINAASAGTFDLLMPIAKSAALQAFVETGDGSDLLTAYKRAANILKKENWTGPQAMSSAEEQGIPQTGEEDPLALVDEPILKDAVAEMTSGQAGADLPQEKTLIAALDAAEPKASAAVDAEDFTAAMAALASLRKPIDEFFDHVTVNDPDAAKRERRLNLLMRFRDAVNRVADFSKIEG
jgi:glycyl-tRNA synthetase beta chain